MPLKQLFSKAELPPPKLFLIDGFGAILSAFLLGVVLVKYESVFGIPSSTLYFLATIPIFFAIYDFYCYRKGYFKSGLFLKGIAVLNIAYCFISIGFAIYHSRIITSLGRAYIAIEIVVVLILATIEYSAGQRVTKD